MKSKADCYVSFAFYSKNFKGWSALIAPGRTHATPPFGVVEEFPLACPAHITNAIRKRRSPS